MTEMRRDRLAVDRASVRRTDEDGRLHVEITNISKAMVNGYLTEEIPQAAELGLTPGRVYQLLRHPDELEKAVPTFNNLPVLSRHALASAADPMPDLVIGSTGTDAVFEAPYLKNSMVIWSADSIEAIESGDQREISSAYRYEADMTPGEYLGVKFDGVMRNIRGSHVAIVSEGRAGPDVLVGDAAPSPVIQPPIVLEPVMPKATVALSRKALLASGALRAYLKPKLAQDAKVDFGAVLKGVTAKSFAADKAAIVTRLKAATEGKLAKDADIADVLQMLDQLDDVTDDLADVPQVDADPMAGQVPPPAADDDDAKMRAAMKAAGMSDEQIEKVCAAMKGDTTPPPAADADKDEDKKDMVTKPAMDAAIAKAAQAATAAALKTAGDIRDAERAIRPYVGELAMSFDSAEGVYRHAFKMLGQDVEGVHPSALPKMLKLIPVPGARPNPRTAQAHDAAAAADFAKKFPHANRLAN